MASTSDDQLYTALMEVTRELSRVATLLETLVNNDADKENRLRVVEQWVARVPVDQEKRLRALETWVNRLPATLFAAIAGAAGTVYTVAAKMTGKG
ncbi:hypothetical protein BKA00_007435 [Actinomadura coerulea]|uniref:Uncharacterized protein n=1 Tax=Actinomadura coerulea TaxID=46159 RepID=A0A7X0G6V8_9ACTN|nr:hypothetical protein [Actinomadura coerulea]MBB6400521.1 hypothetical protein [Actinomadura coerulea]GGQ07815.1 hypothetical protein GCM10010187_24880 [Actinomadura coerulea]